MSEPELAVFDDSGSAVSKGSGSKPSFNKRRLTIIVVVILLIIPTIYFVRKHTTKQATNLCNGKEGNQLYQDAAMLITPGVSVKLRRVVDDMKIQPGFEKDVSCLYTASVYYLNISDPDNAKKYLGLFERKTNDGAKLVKVLGDAKTKLMILKTRLSVLEQSKTDVNKRTQYFD